MAIEVVKVYKESFPALRFIGKRYTNEDRDSEGGFGKQWNEWNGGGVSEKLIGSVGSKPFVEDPIGLMTMRGDMTGFTYWVGHFFAEGTKTPEGYDHIDLPKSDIGVGWLKGNEESGEIFGGPPHDAVIRKLGENGIGDFRNDIDGEGSDTYCFYERYNCPRFTEPDAEGNVILDYGNYIK